MQGCPTPRCVIEWESTDDGIRVVDAVRNELSIEFGNWSALAVDEPMSRPTDAELVVETESVTLPVASPRVYDLAAGGQLPGDEAGTVDRLDGGPYLVVVDSTIQLFVRFDGPSTVTADGDTSRFRVTFSGRSRVHLGFRSHVRTPGETVTVPATTGGVARAISAMASAHRTTSPDRTLWRMRRHPPAIEIGDDYDVPMAVESAIPETGIELAVPDSLRDLFVTAPLAYYLGAEVSIETRATPRLRAPDAGVDFDLGPRPVETVPETLSRVFWLDCIARNGGPYAEPGLQEHDLLTSIGIDHEAAYHATPAERLATYLDAPYESIADEFPAWSLAMHVDPVMEHVSTLPFLLNHMSLVYPPETVALEGSKLMARSLDDFYRGPPGPIASVEMLEPKLRRGRIHGWLADGAPIDVFKTLPAAYENALAYLEADRTEEMSVVVVLNDRDMTGEHERVASIYQDRAADSRMNVRLEYELTCEELAALFEESHEFLHYIGHCEVDGLRCADGNLSVDSIAETNVETFFLNACGSYYEGLDLVRKGSVAGAVTFRKVLDEPAAKVGTALARLLINGFPIETALRLSRRRIMMGKDYAVVGNGMQTLSMGTGHRTGVVYVETQESGDLAVSWEPNLTWDLGASYRLDAGEGFSPRLAGNRTEFRSRPSAFVAFLEDRDLPVIYDGEFYWSHEVVERFDGGTR